MKCVATVFVCTRMIQLHIDAFVIKVGLSMNHHRLVQLMSMNAIHLYHIVQKIPKYHASIYPAHMHADNVHMVSNCFFSVVQIINTKMIRLSNLKGYTGNGHYCRDVDECETNNGGCSLSPFVPCINTRVRFWSIVSKFNVL